MDNKLGSRQIDTKYNFTCRSQLARHLRCEYTAARLLGLRVRIPPATWMSFSWECYA